MAFYLRTLINRLRYKYSASYRSKVWEQLDPALRDFKFELKPGILDDVVRLQQDYLKLQLKKRGFYK